MGVDEKVGSADEREDGGGSIHLSDTLVTGPSEREGEEEREKERRWCRRGEDGGE